MVVDRDLREVRRVVLDLAAHVLVQPRERVEPVERLDLAEDPLDVLVDLLGSQKRRSSLVEM